MKKSLLSILTVTVLIGFHSKSNALLGKDDGSRNLLAILQSKQVDAKLESLRAGYNTPVRVQGVEFDHCNVNATPITCTYKLKFLALGSSDESTAHCVLTVDVDVKNKVSNITDPVCKQSAF